MKNYYGNSVVDMQVLPQFENLFSANGYIGSGRTYFNANHVFLFATDFTNINGFTSTGSYQITSNGLNLSGNLISNNTYSEANTVLSFNQTITIKGDQSAVFAFESGYFNGTNVPFISTYFLSSAVNHLEVQKIRSHRLLLMEGHLMT